MANPYSLTFGMKPEQYISRIAQTDTILDTMCGTPANTHMYLISGVRGVGKTVMLSAVAEKLNKEEWIVLDLSAADDYIQEFAGELYEAPGMKQIFVQAKLTLSFMGVGVSVENAKEITSYKTVVKKMIREVEKKGKRILLLVDEVGNTAEMVRFVKFFQVLLRENASVFLLMTGLYENIYELENHKELTFLLRAPKIFLGPLNYSAVKNAYLRTLRIGEEAATEMTALTKGYPYAYQVLGYLYWNARKKSKDLQVDLEELLPDYDQYLQEGVYEKIWSKLSGRDREVMKQLARQSPAEVKQVREALGMTPGQFSVYRDRLKKKGIIDTEKRGIVALALPRFEEFIKSKELEYSG